MKGYCEECKKVIDETEIFRFGKRIVCRECWIKLKKASLRNKDIKELMGIVFVDPCKKCRCTVFECRNCEDHDFYRVANDRVKMKANFKEIRERVFNSYWHDRTFTVVKDGLIDSLIDKDYNALRG